MDFKDKNVLVLGAGISGRSVAEVLVSHGAKVTLNDSKKLDDSIKEFQKLKYLGIDIISGWQNESLLQSVDYIVVSPGITIELPIITAARSMGITVMSEIEVAFSICQAPIIAITGTNGKTTTTALTGEILKAAGKNTVIGGNIGAALSQEVQGTTSSSVVVAEISSFQLEGIIHFRPYIAVILNLTPDHLDRHHTMEGYQAAKERIFENQNRQDYLVLNYDDPNVQKMANRTDAQIVFFTMQKEPESGGCIKDDQIVIKWQGQSYVICDVKDVRLLGKHNIENILAACCATFLAGVSPSIMADVLKKFSGVEHRIEPVATIDGVSYYNDSKATNPESSVKALEAFPGNIILIAGGRDKNTNLTEFMTLARDKVDHMILIGEAQARFFEAASQQGVCHIHTVMSLEEAVATAHRLARSPQVVLLSPACASYDMFNNYEERGRLFKQLVQRLT